MEELIKRLERVIATGVPDKDGMHPISAETVLEVVRGLSEHSTNLAEVGTDCISRQQAIDDIWTVSPLASLDRKWVDRWLRQLPPANISETPNSSDTISRQQAIEALERAKQNIHHNIERAIGDAVCEVLDAVENGIKQLPPIQPEPREIGYDDCANALLKMWMDNVLTDGEYYRIANKLNEKWGRTELPEPYKGVTG